MSQVRFKDLLAEPVRNGVYKPKEFHGSGVRLVNMKELFAFDTLSDQPDSRIELTPAELAKAGLSDGDLLFARRSFVLAGAGKCSLVVDPSEALTFESSMIRARPNPERADSRFLFYYFKSPQGRARMASIAARTAVSGITGSNLSALEIEVPGVDAQRKIANVLKQFDDLIENNRRRVEVLEEMARAIYREWFVKFRYPGHEDVPLIDSALGLIPDGWEETTLGEAARWFSGGTPKTTVAEYWNGHLPWITSGTLTSMLLDRSDRMLTELGAASGTRVVERDALLFVVRGMSLAKEFRVGIADARLAFGQDVKALVASSGMDPMYLALSVITRAEEIQRMVEFAGHGTGRISTDRLQALHLLRPPVELQRHFAETFRPLREMMTALKLAVDRLLRLRDELLPKLVTGQIDLSTLEVDGLVSTSSTDGVGVA